MNEAPWYSRLDALATSHEEEHDELLDEVVRIGSSVEGLQMLVARYKGSANTSIVRLIAFQIARSGWEHGRRRRRLNDLVLDFLEAAGQSDDARTLVNCLTAVKILSVLRALKARTPKDEITVGDFLVHCLDNPDYFVRSGCLDALRHLVTDGTLQGIVSPERTADLRRRVAAIAASDAGEFDIWLEGLEDFAGGNHRP